MDPIIALIVSGIFSVLVAYLTAQQKTKSELKKERAKLQLDVVMKQKYEYFLPFKYCADEFERRLIHIFKTLQNEEYDDDRYEDMIKRLNQDFASKELEWFFNDEVGSNGGYFVTSTIYQNCMLFYWMKRIQAEHPFIPLELKDVDINTQERYKSYLAEDKLLSLIENRKCDIYDFIKNIKIAISRKKGIPHALQDSIGDFLFDYSEKRVLNYEEFCNHLMDERKRIKFLPAIKFWTEIVKAQNDVDQDRLKKIGALIAILGYLNNANIRE